jgi:2'-5' RNA ligase
MSFYAALIPPEDTKIDLLECSRLHGDGPPPGLRLAPAEDWHITLAFSVSLLRKLRVR